MRLATDDTRGTGRSGSSFNEGFYRDGFGYAAMMNQSPQTIGYALADSPVAMAANYYDKFAEWSDSDGEPEQVFRYDEMVDAISLYWLTKSGASSSRLYWERVHAGGGPFNAVDIPERSGRGHCVSRRDLPTTANLGGACLRQPHLLARGVGTAGDLQSGAARCLQVVARSEG
jgi:hypothetical protein